MNVQADLIARGVDFEADEDLELELFRPALNGLLGSGMAEIDRVVVRDLNGGALLAIQGARADAEGDIDLRAGRRHAMRFVKKYMFHFASWMPRAYIEGLFA